MINLMICPSIDLVPTLCTIDINLQDAPKPLTVEIPTPLSRFQQVGLKSASALRHASCPAIRTLIPLSGPLVVALAVNAASMIDVDRSCWYSIVS